MTETMVLGDGPLKAFPDISKPAQHLTFDSTLPVNSNVTLVLASDSVLIQDDSLPARTSLDCCGLSSSKPKSTRTIPYFNILWAELSESDIVIQYALPASKSIVRPSTIAFTIDESGSTRASIWTERLLNLAYGASQQRKRIKVLINPHGGTGLARKLFEQDIEPIFGAAQCELAVDTTLHRGHAAEIAAKLDADRWDVVACCSGDGLPHEVFNGLAKQSDALAALSKVAVVQLPCGSGNAMSLNLNGTDSASMAALAVVKGVRTPLDLVSITQKDRRILSFLSQSVGILAECDLGTEHLRWMGGMRFEVGFLMRLVRRTVYPCDVALKLEIGSKDDIKEAYRREVASKPSEVDADLTSQTQINRLRPEPNLAPSSVGDSVTESSMPTSTAQEPASAPDMERSYSHPLPSLRFGTVTSPIPSTWTLTSHPDLGTFTAGNMPYVAAATKAFPTALPSDGCLDVVTWSGTVPRMTVISGMGRVADGSYMDMSHIQYQKVSAYRLIPRPTDAGKRGYISIDGESIPYEPFQAEVHRGLGTVLSRNGRLFEK